MYQCCKIVTLRKQYEYEKSLLESYGHKSIINFEEWLNLKYQSITDIGRIEI